MTQCKCIFPTAGEEELITVPGTEPDTAIRVFQHTGNDGYVRLQQLSYDSGLGWYVQKSMVIPRDVLEALLPQLRKALCFMPKGAAQPATTLSVPFMRLGPCCDEPELERASG